MLDCEADDETVTYSTCRNIFHKECFDEWSRTKEQDGVDVACPKCGTLLDVELRVYQDDSDRSYTGSDYFTAGLSIISISPDPSDLHIPRLTDLRTYNNRTLTPYVDPRPTCTCMRSLSPCSMGASSVSWPRAVTSRRRRGPHTGFDVEHLTWTTSRISGITIRSIIGERTSMNLLGTAAAGDQLLPRARVHGVLCGKYGVER
jgi:hypothetical protein